MLPWEILKKIRYIEIPARKLVDEVFSGEYRSVFKGRGMEFSEVREYLPGDDIRIIDWNVTARFGRPFVKKFVEERELTVILLVDMSGSEDFGSGIRSKRELACEIGAILAFSALKNNDKVGLILFSDIIEEFVPPRKGRRHVLRIIRDILAFQPKSRGTNLETALGFLNEVMRKKAIVFIISDFISPDFEQALKATAARHDLNAFTILDPREISIGDKEKFFPALVEIEDAETGHRRIVNLRDRHFLARFAEKQEERLEKLKQLFNRVNIEHTLLKTNEDYMKELMRFFKERQKKARY